MKTGVVGRKAVSVLLGQGYSSFSCRASLKPSSMPSVYSGGSRLGAAVSEASLLSSLCLALGSAFLCPCRMILHTGSPRLCTWLLSDGPFGLPHLCDLKDWNKEPGLHLLVSSSCLLLIWISGLNDVVHTERNSKSSLSRVSSTDYIQDKLRFPHDWPFLSLPLPPPYLFPLP